MAPSLGVLSLFSGFGMLDEGMRAGLEYLGRRSHVVAYVEREAYAAAGLLARMDEASLEPAPIWCGDFGELELGRLAGRVAGISAGFPCQPWSVAGSQLGEDDERWLWPLIERAIRALGPELEFVFLENVPGLVSGGGLAVVLRGLAALGLDAEWCRIPAGDVGAAHQRERVFILAFRAGGGFANMFMDDAKGGGLRGRGLSAGQGSEGRGAGHAHRRSIEMDDAIRISGGERAGRERVLEIGAGLVDADGARPRGGKFAGTSRAQAIEGARGEGVERRRGELAIASSEGLQERRREPGDLGEEHAAIERDSAPLADAECGGRGERRRAGPIEPGQCHDRPLFAPGPSDPRWPDIIAGRFDPWPGAIADQPSGGSPLAPAIKPGLRVLVDGLALVVDESRADQLRGGGNGVVAAQAGVAFVHLARRVMT